MDWKTADHLLWIAFFFISGLSAVNALSIFADYGLVPGSGVLFWFATAIGSAVIAGLFYSTLKHGSTMGRKAGPRAPNERKPV
jgi:hypothetical protein